MVEDAVQGTVEVLPISIKCKKTVRDMTFETI